MAVAITRNALIASTASSTPGASITTASTTNTHGALLLLAVCTGLTGGASPPASVTGLGLTWAQVNTAAVGNICNTVFWAQGVSSTGTLVITWTGSPTSVIWQLDEFVGAWINLQSATSAANTATPSTTLTATRADSAVYSSVNHNDTTQTASAGTNMSALLGAGTTNVGSPSQHQAVGWNNAGASITSIAFSWSGAGNAPMVSVEMGVRRGGWEVGTR